MALDTRENRTKRDQYERLRSKLWLEKSSFDTHWKMLADFIKPNRHRAYVTEANRGNRKNQNIIDSTATLALRTFVSSLHTGMSNPASAWFKLSTPDADLAKFPPVKKWLYDVTEIMLSAFIKSNLYAAYPIVYGDLGLFGTSAMGIFADPKEIFFCRSFPIGSYALGMNAKERIDTFAYEYTRTVRQLVEEFGLEAISPSARKLWDEGNYEEKIEICWLIAPNPGADASKLYAKDRMPWHSCHFEKGSGADRVLSESGYEDFPIMAPRWDRAAGDVYATDCPAMAALGDIRALQMMAKRKAQGVELMINPAIQAPTHLRGVGVNLLPGGTNFVDQLQQQEGIRPVREVNLPIDEIREDIGDVRQLIRRAFYEDLFLMISSIDKRDVTATEIDERREEKLTVLGHALQNTNDDLHEPTINRCYPLLDRAGMIPPAPPELEGQDLKIEYQSILGQVQKMMGVTALDRFVRTGISLGEMFPEVKYKLDPYAIIDEYAERLGVDPEILVSSDDARAAVQALQKQAAAQQQTEMAAQAAKGARDLSQANTTGDNALAQIIQGART